MTRLAEIESHIASMGELLDLVSAMRALAGMRMQEAQRTLPAIRRYAESVAAGVADTLLLMGDAAPNPTKTSTRRALVLCTAEHGFVGGFNERLVEAAEATLAPRDLLLVLGTRGYALTLERGHRAIWTHPMATRCAAAPETAHHLSFELYRRIAEGEIGLVEVMYARYRQGSESTVERRLLLPLERSRLAAKPRQAPLHNLAPASLYEKLLAEFVFALLTEAAVESIASENAARFEAMASADEGVSKKLSQLNQDSRLARQSDITTELLEIVTGALALGGGRR